jgi:hypothetical protein
MFSTSSNSLDTKSYEYITQHALPLLEEAIKKFGGVYSKEDQPLLLLIALHVNSNEKLLALYHSGKLSLLIQIMKLWMDLNFIESSLNKLSSELLATNKKHSKLDFFLAFAKANHLLDFDAETKEEFVTVKWPELTNEKTLTVPARIPYAIAILEPASYLSLARAGLIPVEWDWDNFGHGRYAHWIQLYILSQAILEEKLNSPLLSDSTTPLKVILEMITSTELLQDDLKESSTWDLLMDNYFFYTDDLLSKMAALLKAGARDEPEQAIIERLQQTGLSKLIDIFYSNDNLLHEFHGKINTIMLNKMPALAAKILVSPVKHDFREGKDWNDFKVPEHMKRVVDVAISTYNDVWQVKKPVSLKNTFFCISHAVDTKPTINTSLQRLGEFYQNDLLLFKCPIPEGKRTSLNDRVVKSTVVVTKHDYADQDITGEHTSGETPFPCYKR